MEEDAIQVYIRHRTELLKAIYDNTPPEQEVGDYLISKMNLENHNITYEKIDVDVVCDSFSEYILSKAKEKKTEFGTMHNFRPAMAKSYGTDHNYRDRVKRAFNENDNKKYNYPLHSPQKDGEKYGPYRARNMIPHTMKHSMWPEINPFRIAFDGGKEGRDEIIPDPLSGIPRKKLASIEPVIFPASHYLDANPFDEKHHPVRKRRVDTGMPEWENMLREYYLSDNKWAEKGMEIEDTHKKDYINRDKTGTQDIQELVKVGEAIRDKTGVATGKKEDEYKTVKRVKHGVYHGINKGEKNHKYSFLGGNDGHESDTKHQHTLRLRDFKRWQKENPKLVKELESQDMDLEEAHFNDRMKKLDSNDIFTETIEPKISDNPYDDLDARGKSTLADTEKIPHGHGMGWDTWNKGLEFLSPKERSLVIEHVDKYGTDNPAHQSVTLPDGQRIHMHRIKANMQMRNNAEVDHWTRSQKHPGANKAKHIEADTDNTRLGTEGMVAKALKGVYLKDGFVHEGEPYTYSIDPETNEEKKVKIKETAFKLLMDKIEEHYEGDKLLEHFEAGEHGPAQRNLPPFSPSDIKEYEKVLKEGGTLKEAFAKKLSDGSHILLSPDGLHKLVGYNQDDLSPSMHPMFKGQKEPFLSKDVMKAVKKELEMHMGVSEMSKPIRNALTTFRTPHGPRKDNPLLREGDEKHFYDHDGKYRTLAYPFSHAFANVGGHGRPITTLAEILHDFKAHDFEGNISALGEKAEGGRLEANPKTVGAYGHLHSHYLENGVSNHTSALGILSKTDATVHSQNKTGSKVGKGRNNKTNSSDHDHTRSPGLAPILEYGDEEEEGWTGIEGKSRTNKELDKKNIFSYNPYTATSSVGKEETSINMLAGHSHLLSTINRRTSAPNSPANNFLRYADIENNPSFLSTADELNKVMTNLPTAPKKNVADVVSGKDIEDLEMLQNELDIEEDGAGDSEIITSLRDKINQIKSNIEMKEKRAREYGKQAKKLGDFGGVRNMMEQAHTDDRNAVAEYFRTKIKPAIVKEHPDAFHPDNPKALVNTLRAVKDAQRGLFMDGDHNISIRAHHYSKKEEDMSSDTHYNLANQMKTLGPLTNNVIDPSKHGVQDILEMLDLPNDDAHKEHAKKYLQTLSGPVHAYSIGQLATMSGLDGNPMQWNPKDKEMFEGKGHGDVHTHLDNVLREGQASFPPARKDTGNVYPKGHPKEGQTSTTPNRDFDRAQALFKRNPIYNALGFLHQNARNEMKLGGYGLQYHQAPTPLTKLSKVPNAHNRSNEGTLLHQSQGGHSSLEYHHARRKDIASNILSFDTSPDIDLKPNAPVATKKEIGWMTAPVKPLRSLEGAVPQDHFTSGLMDWGWSGQAEIGAEHDYNGNISVGTNTSEEKFHSLPLTYLQSLHKDTHSPQHVESMLTNAEPFQQNPTQLTQDPTGQMPSDDMMNVSKADLPKEIPLIEPLHRIFDIKDMSELRGFTGEWVVSIQKDGKRCKVSKKNGRVELEDENGVKQSCEDEMRASFRAACKKNFVIDGVLNDGEFYINDILLYDTDDVTELTTRERIKILRGQFESYHPVFVPSPSDIRITDEVGLEDAVKELGKDSDKLLLRDAKSTYMKGEEKHPKWVMLAKSDITYHVPFTMEIDDSHFIIRLPEDVVKYDIVDNKAVNPVAAIGEITASDYSLKLAKSLESYWQEGLTELLKEELEVKGDSEVAVNHIDSDKIEEQSAGILKPKKDSNLIMKPNEMAKALLLIERALDKMEKGHSNMAGRGLGIDVGGGVESPRGPTSLTAEQSLPDWDMKKRPTEDLEKPEDYPGRKQKKKQTASQSSVFDDKNLDE